MFNIKRISASLMISAMLLTSGTTALAMDYTIQRGDSLFLIGQRFGVTVDELRNANGISGDLIFAGETITIPDQEQNTYTVVRGDSLFLIAQRNGTTIEQLKMANNLTSDLIFPDQILKVPRGSTENSSGRVMNVTQREIDILARAVYGESRGEPFKGQVAVAAVILNRVRHNEFPNTIEGVVFQPGQFCVVDDGQIWLTPNQSAYRAVEEALKGNDPTGGAIFFYNPAKTNHRWMRSRPVLTTIGAHVFAR